MEQNLKSFASMMPESLLNEMNEWCEENGIKKRHFFQEAVRKMLDEQKQKQNIRNETIKCSGIKPVTLFVH